VHPNPPLDERSDRPIATLGDLLYADKRKTRVAEDEWVELVRSSAAGDQFALRTLYECTHRLVFTLIVRITHDPAAAEELTVDVFDSAWHRASKYDPAHGSVVGWVMDQARSRAVDWLHSEPRNECSDQGPVLEGAMVAVTRHEREAIEDALFSDDLLRPSAGLWGRLSRRIAEANRYQFELPAPRSRPESAWEQVAPGIFCKLLASDSGKQQVSMLVRLAPGIAYPPHRHAGVEELHLLHGELWIDERKLGPGDYNRAEPGTADARVWSETGCTCVLITSDADELG
jgi:DNA-directed RNA polymerase specialized sigma24 family protein